MIRPVTLPKMAKRLEVQLNSPMFNGSSPKTILSFLPAFFPNGMWYEWCSQVRSFLGILLFLTKPVVPPSVPERAIRAPIHCANKESWPIALRCSTTFSIHTQILIWSPTPMRTLLTTSSRRTSTPSITRCCCGRRLSVKALYMTSTN